MTLLTKDFDKPSIAIIGLGYVGLPLFCQLSLSFSVVGYDNDQYRIDEITDGKDSRNSVSRQMLCESLRNNKVTNSIEEISHCNFFIVTVPTPINKNNIPDTTALENACWSLSSILHRKSIVVFESTVYPGATEELCVPILCKSGLQYNEDFYVGYSPERINVGDIEHQLAIVTKIVSGSTNEVSQIIASVYQTVLTSSVVVASCIKVAEAAKMYENVQRDILIALANEYSDYCKNEGIDIYEVTECAATKWNFAKVFPGLVGGHCIAVDPYYLIHQANKLKIDIPLICCGRETNELKVSMVSKRIIQFIYSNSSSVSNRILLLGFTYKANTGDTRNSKVADVYNILKKEFPLVDCYDPFVDIEMVEKDFAISLLAQMPDINTYNFVIRMVNHKAFMNVNNVIDIKYFL